MLIPSIEAYDIHIRNNNILPDSLETFQIRVLILFLDFLWGAYRVGRGNVSDLWADFHNDSEKFRKKEFCCSVSKQECLLLKFNFLA